VNTGEAAAVRAAGSLAAEPSPSVRAAAAALTGASLAAPLPCPTLPCPALPCLELEDGGRRGFILEAIETDLDGLGFR